LQLLLMLHISSLAPETSFNERDRQF
jgi:hypothetical protein